MSAEKEITQAVVNLINSKNVETLVPCSSAAFLRQLLLVPENDYIQYPRHLRQLEALFTSNKHSLEQHGVSTTIKPYLQPLLEDGMSRMIVLEASALPTSKQKRIKTKHDYSTYSSVRERLTKANLCDVSQPFVELCPYVTRAQCETKTQDMKCPKVHFVPVMTPNTDPTFGDCSYLNTCYRMNTCKYIHYEIEDPGPESITEPITSLPSISNETRMPVIKPVNGLPMKSRNFAQYPAQWINCDVRHLDFSILGKYDIIIADPPWDIHMSLPYGTMTDEEMQNMPLGQLQNDGGLLFLWVTVRAQDLGRQCIQKWGYDRIDELIWVKTSQLPKLIRTGRTGHWLNHGKEHCIVAYKRPRNSRTSQDNAQKRNLSKPYLNSFDKLLTWANKGIDTDVIVSEVQETSRKPAELYEIIERICPFGRKIEIFGRLHNTRPGWLTLGNQLGKSSRVWDPELLRAWNERYPQNRIETSKQL